MKISRKVVIVFSLAFMVLTALCFSSCSKKMGYAVTLWSVPEENISDGTIVPVYIKSNIGHCYVIGNPETKKKCEVPLWQISEPVSKSKVKVQAQKFKEYQNCYAKVKLDGLPVRAEPQNVARQVYRTREGEILKVLYKGKGAQVMAGNEPLEGDWLRVLTQDGTLGWCFSYNLYVYNEKEIQEETQEGEVSEFMYDDILTKVMNSTWYPEEYQIMINTKRINLDEMDPKFKFDTGFKTDVVYLNMKDFYISFPFKGLTKLENRVYQFNGENLVINIKTGSSIQVVYTKEANEEGAVEHQYTYNLGTMSEDIFTVIDKEQTRRRNEYNKIVNAGPIYKSQSYGTITFMNDGSFEWSDYDLLTPSVITENSGNYGKATIEYFIPYTMKSEYDGVITMKFEYNAKKINFLYKMEPNGIRLEDAQKAKYKGNLLQEKSSNPVVIFFAK